jgi:hypothetical protein
MNKNTWTPKYKHVYGFGGVIKKLDKEIAALKGRTLKGMIKAQSLIRHSMDAMPPKIPVDLGNLRHSWFCTTSNGAVIAGSGPVFDNTRKDASKMTKDHAKVVKDALKEAVQSGRKEGPNIRFGLSAYYAVPVHEMVGKSINWTRPGSGPWFFDAAVKRNRSQILKLIAQEAKIR